MSFSNATPDNAHYLASKTGLNYYVAMAWLLNEKQQVNNPTNPLNILAGGAPGQRGTSGRFATYASPHAGLDAAAWLINNSHHYAGIRAAIKTKDPFKEARAIELSPWAGGHYGGGGSSAGNLTKTLAGLLKVPMPYSPSSSAGSPTPGPGGSTAPYSGGPTPTATGGGGPGPDNRICAWGTANSPGICIPEGHILTPDDILGIMTHLQLNGFFSGDDPMGTARQVTQAILSSEVGKPWNAATLADISKRSGIASAATTGTYNPLNSLPSVVGDIAGTVTKVATYIIAVIVIIVGIWLYTKGASSPAPEGA